jgi:division protein CdvB (Snf7/Vps24/ESCRT-III family)
MFNKFEKWNNVENSVLEKLRARLGQKKPSIQENAIAAVYKLEATLNKLRHTTDGLTRKDEKLFSKCIEAQVAKNLQRAVMYANECAQVRNMAKLVISSELVIEQAIVRLQTIGELGDIMVTMSPVVEVVQETRGRLFGVIPSVAGKLDEVTHMLSSSLTEMSSGNSSENGAQGSNKEALKILEEANVAAEEKFREKFPELPQDLTDQDLDAQESEDARVPIALTATGDESVVVPDVSIKEQVYDYVKTCDGNLSIIQCASYLGVFPKDVEKAILKLKEEGKIALE